MSKKFMFISDSMGAAFSIYTQNGIEYELGIEFPVPKSITDEEGAKFSLDQLEEIYHWLGVIISNEKDNNKRK